MDLVTDIDRSNDTNDNESFPSHFPFENLSDPELSIMFSDNVHISNIDYLNSCDWRYCPSLREWKTFYYNFNEHCYSVTSNLQQFQDHILFAHNLKYDVIGFCETRLDSNIASLYTINGYTMYCKHRNRHGGGVAMYVSSDYTSSIINYMTICEPFIECVSVELCYGRDKYFFCQQSIDPLTVI